MSAFAKRSSVPRNRLEEVVMSDASAKQFAGNFNTAPTRRAFLKAGAAAGGGLLLGFHLPFAAHAQDEPVFAPNAFIRIDNAGNTTLVMPQVEMGQGIYTAVAMILAEE